MNAWVITGFLILSIVSGLGGVWEGERIGATKCQAAQLAPEKAATAVAIKTADQQLTNGNLALGAVIVANAGQAQIQVIHDVVTKTVVKYVQTHPAIANCGLDADGLRIWNAANAGTK